MNAAVLLLTLFAAAPADPAKPADDLAPLIDAVQRRCVKIYGAGAGREHGYATGILVSPDGLILTAQGMYLSGERLRVVLSDGGRHEAELLRRDESLQAALLKIDAKTPQYFELSDKNPAGQGDWVLAVSNLFNVASNRERLSVNLGIVSVRAVMEARHRTQDVPYEGEIILVDAITSNPGSAGGALVDLDGRLVGMLGKLFESKNAGTRLNYAVPVESLKPFVEGRASKPIAESKPKASAVPGSAYLGLRLFRLGGEKSPAYVDYVSPGSPAKNAGLKKDDLILVLGETEIRNCKQYDDAMKELAPGKPVSFIVKRGSKIETLTITPDAKPEEKP